MGVGGGGAGRPANRTTVGKRGGVVVGRRRAGRLVVEQRLVGVGCVDGLWLFSVFFFSSRRRHTIFLNVLEFRRVLFRSLFFFFKQKTAYEISECDWSSDVCSSDLSTLIGRASCRERVLRLV